MDFSRLPDGVILQIIGYLSLEENFQVRGVDKAFHRIAQLVISRTKSLDLTEDRFRDLTSDQLTLILELCFSKLEMIKFPLDGENGIPLASIFANYECPRLTDLDLGQSVVDYSIFDRIIRNVPNIESLAWHGKFVGFPNVVVDNLTKLKLGYANDEIMESLTGRFPNLKEVYLVIKADSTSYVFDEFFASVPQVHVVDIEMTKLYFTLEVDLEDEMVSFWNLPLTSLRIKSTEQGCPDDTILQKVATSFPHLKTLRIDPIDANDNGGFAALATLEELEILELGLGFYDRVDHEISQLVHCKKLRKLNLHLAKITTDTFTALFQCCPKFDDVIISSIVGVDTPEKVVVLLQSLSGIGKRDIAIEFHSDDVDFIKSIWESGEAKSAMKKLEEIDELKIEIGWKLKDIYDDGSSEDTDESMDDE